MKKEKKNYHTAAREARQEQILDWLSQLEKPLSGQELANRLDVTRQVIVHDIALLKSSGYPILSTARGYMLMKEELSSRHVLLLEVFHRPDQTASELYILVDHGVAVLDVQVAHPLYGTLSGTLDLQSRKDVEHFLQQAKNTQAVFLSSLTDGWHFHTVHVPSKKRLQEAISALADQGIEAHLANGLNKRSPLMRS
ncbi:transcription repressor NadR [Alicyclobacillus tolerans]|uniref:Transcription repressor NadR n=1 Tax=Alicyclobacillus tolerans TaxID=90970 RepID=A0A1M6W983_9BACL|nr:transcription repressor NadR [Alicyclobacillus montanus]SHK90291.1 hypothetical protein SAMN05443507_12628 [Alicyclobacillus montanus]